MLDLDFSKGYTLDRTSAKEIYRNKEIKKPIDEKPK